jgi:drug/metabolite transporter (DMT)-like permease
VSDRKVFRAYAVLLIAQLAVGAAAIFARYALSGTGPITASALRLCLATVPLLVYQLVSRQKHAVSSRHEFVLALAGLALAVHFASWIGSLLYTSVALSTLLVCTSPIWTALYDTLILKQPATKSFWLAFAAAALGVGLITSVHASPAPIEGYAVPGDLLAILGGFAFAIYLIVIRSVSDLYPTQAIVVRTYAWAAAGLSLAGLVSHQPIPAANDFVSWAGIIAMAVVSQLLGHTAMNASLKHFSSSTVAISTLLEPVFAGLLAAVLFAEHLQLQAIIGSVVVLVSIGAILKLQAPSPGSVFDSPT